MADKDWRLMLDMLVPVVREFVLTRVNMERSADPQELANYLGGKVPYRITQDSSAALEALLNGASANDILVVAGSLYLLGEIRPAFQQVGQSKATAAKTIFTS
jgi:dihydrofolate synthase/folylpolyglutamate synthase